jgi:hypothetical protein
LLSSAILYVAIVAIWACVLIPRWLRRDSPAFDAVSGVEDGAEAGADPVGETEPMPAPVPGPASVPRPASVPGPARAPAPRRRREEESRCYEADEDRAAADPAHRRVLSARRRLLLMLVGLSVASGVLAGAGMAAWWVVVPPTVMLLGYLLLLRAAAQADAEHREMPAYPVAREVAEADRAAVRHPGPVAATPAAEAKVITIAAPPEAAEEQIYDQYADAKLRAVGD